MEEGAPWRRRGCIEHLAHDGVAKAIRAIARFEQPKAHANIEVFEQPDECRIARPDPGRHLSFSLGLHHCLGSALARLEGRIAIEELTRRFPPLELAAPPTRRTMLVLRGFESVPVRARSRASQPAA